MNFRTAAIAVQVLLGIAVMSYAFSGLAPTALFLFFAGLSIIAGAIARWAEA
jgi:hypothetical protein